MKRISAILGLCLVASSAAFAQKALVKDVEREMKSNPDSYPNAVKKLEPAFTNS